MDKNFDVKWLFFMGSCFFKAPLLAATNRHPPPTNRSRCRTGVSCPLYGERAETKPSHGRGEWRNVFDRQGSD